MKLFFDTSSLIKLYFKEDDTSRLDELFTELVIQEIFISEISLIDFHSAIYKKVRTRDLSVQNAGDILNAFGVDKNKFKIIQITTEIINTAKLLIERYGVRGLRTLDAIQFASVYLNQDQIHLAISHDKLLNSFLNKEGINIYR